MAIPGGLKQSRKISALRRKLRASVPFDAKGIFRGGVNRPGRQMTLEGPAR